MSALSGKRIGILVASGSDQTEMTVMRQVMDDAEASPLLVSVKKNTVRGWLNTDWGGEFAVDLGILDASAADFDGVVIPGGLIGADTLRADKHAVRLVQDMLAGGKPVAAMGHAPWVLIEAGAVRHRRVTSIEAIRTDLENAGGLWVDEATMADGNVVSGRNRHDLPDFMAQFVEKLILG